VPDHLVREERRDPRRGDPEHQRHRRQLGSSASMRGRPPADLAYWTVMDTSAWVTAIVAALAGLVAGAWVTAMIAWLPRTEPGRRLPPWRCPGCGTGFRPDDLIPVTGWRRLSGCCCPDEAVAGSSGPGSTVAGSTVPGSTVAGSTVPG